jgi:hypothetical protein
MRDDQIERLKDMAEAVAEVFIEEIDPETWSGAGMSMAEMDSQTRGDRYWCKKNAIQTGTLLARVLDLADHSDRPAHAAQMDDDSAEKEIERFEKQAKKLIDAVHSKTSH